MVATMKPPAVGQKNIFEVFPQLKYITDQREDAWETAVSMGIEAMSRLDKSKWMLGDIVVAVVECYGGRAPRNSELIDDFARTINAEPKRVREYATVAKFWDANNRHEMARLQVITYTHMRDAMRLGDVESAKKFLYECADNGWTVLEARMKLAEQLGAKAPRKKVGTFEATLMQKAGTMHLFQLHQDPDETAVQLEVGSQFIISIYTED